jgi:hypothetical protein
MKMKKKKKKKKKEKKKKKKSVYWMTLRKMENTGI